MKREMNRRRLADIGAIVVLFGLGFALVTGVYRTVRTVVFDMNTPRAMLHFQGLYNPEPNPDGSAFRWTDGCAQLEVPNPGGWVTLEAVLASGPAGRIAPVELRAGMAKLAFTVSDVPRSYTILVPQSDGEQVTMELDSAGMATPRRNLGVIINR